MKPITILTVALIALLILVGAAYAGPTEPADTYVGTGSAADIQFGTTDPNNLELNSGGLGVCEPTRTIYLRWSLADVTRAAGPATRLTLTVNNAQSSNTGQITLYKVADDTWNEATLTQNTAPALGAAIASVSNPTSSPGTVVFSGQALADWIDENSSFVGPNDPIAGNDKVSFGLRVTGCAGFANPTRFDSKEKPGGTGPKLELFDPNAVTLSTFEAAKPGTNWPLFIGLGVLSLAIVGVVAYRRRAAS